MTQNTVSISIEDSSLDEEQWSEIQEKLNKLLKLWATEGEEDLESWIEEIHSIRELRRFVYRNRAALAKWLEKLGKINMWGNKYIDIDLLWRNTKNTDKLKLKEEANKLEKSIIIHLSYIDWLEGLYKIIKEDYLSETRDKAAEIVKNRIWDPRDFESCPDSTKTIWRRYNIKDQENYLRQLSKRHEDWELWTKLYLALTRYLEKNRLPKSYSAKIYAELIDFLISELWEDKITSKDIDTAIWFIALFSDYKRWRIMLKYLITRTNYIAEFLAFNDEKKEAIISIIEKTTESRAIMDLLAESLNENDWDEERTIAAFVGKIEEIGPGEDYDTIKNFLNKLKASKE